jgi:hypothetical protein
MHRGYDRKVFAAGHTDIMKSNFSITSQFVRAAVLVSLLLSLVVESSAQEFKTVQPGVEYAEVTHKLGADPVRINLLRVDLTKVRLDVHHAFDRAIGVETTSAIAKRHGAVAAINAGFFRLDRSDFAGDAAGVMLIDGNLYSESVNDRIAIVLENDKRGTSNIRFEHITAYARVYSSKLEMPEINGINRERRKGEMIMYTSVFGGTTRSSPGGTEITLTGCKKDRCEDFTLREAAGNSPIPAGGIVLSIDAEQTPEQLGFIDRLKRLVDKRDRQFTIRHIMRPTDYMAPNLRKRYAIDVTNGVGQLVKNGKVDVTWQQEKASKSFAETRHPRTAVAKMRDGKFLMMTVDGRQPGVSVGMDLRELAEYLLSIGASDAMNLDGGGSTTMFLDGRVVNKPSDKEGERKVSDAIIVTLRKNARR